MGGRSRFVSLCLALGLCLGARPVTAEPGLTDALRDELSLTRQLVALQRGVDAVEQSRKSLRYAAAVMERTTRETLRRLASYRVARTARDRYARQRARALYKLARGGVLRIAFDDAGAQSPAERIVRGRVIRQMIRQDLEEIHVHHRAEARATVELVEVTRERQALAALNMVDALQQASLELASRRLAPAVEAAHRARRQALAGTGTVGPAEQELLAAVERERDQLAAPGDGSLEVGSLVRPVPGQVVGEYGTYKDAVMRVPMSRNGVELRARKGASVAAVADGTVAFVGELPGFEQAVVVDHGHGYLTLLGRLLGPKVAVGETVTAGQAVGQVAPKRVDDDLGPTVYLELRHGERPVDPTPFLSP